MLLTHIEWAITNKTPPHALFQMSRFTILCCTLYVNTYWNLKLHWISCLCLLIYCFVWRTIDCSSHLCLYILTFYFYIHLSFIITVSRSIEIYGTCKRLHERIRFEMSSAYKTHKAFMPNPKRIRWYERDKGKRSCQAHGQVVKLYILYVVKLYYTFILSWSVHLLKLKI